MNTAPPPENDQQAPAEKPDKKDSVNMVSGMRARSAACWFNFGNIIAMLVPFPLGIFWFGASMVLYALNRHHPNARVGYYTQQAAYRFYAVMGGIIVVGTFFGTNWMAWWITWFVSALIIIPLSVRDLQRIKKEAWCDTYLGDETKH